MENNMKIRITFMEEVLGSSPAKQEIYRDYIASKAPDAATIEDEVAAVGVDEVTEQGMTVFPRTKDGVPFAYDYQIKGMFKDTCGMLARVKTTESSKLKAYKKIIDGLIFVYPREIPYQFDGEIGKCDRPLRAQTAQGERVAIASSETVPAGASLEFEVECLDSAHKKAVFEWLEYGQKRGFSQWRNSGKGRFTFEVIE